MSDLQQALELQELLEEVGERIKDFPQGRSYGTPDGQAFVLAMGGDGAEAMRDLMTAIGHYLQKMQHRRSDSSAAKQEVLRAFDNWLSKLKLE